MDVKSRPKRRELSSTSEHDKHEPAATFIPDDVVQCVLAGDGTLDKPRKMTRAEYQRRYMQRVREDPVKEAEMRRKKQERYHRTKVLAKDMTRTQLREARKRWKAKAARAYEKVKLQRQFL